MSSGAHLSKELHELIKQIGETRSKQEEDKIIILEAQQLKQNIGNAKLTVKQKKENLIRAIYIEMLGHDAESFCAIHAVNLAQNKVLNLKRMGYLACALFFNEKSELLIMLVSTLQRDLQSGNLNEVSAALNCCGKLLFPNIVHALFQLIIKLLDHKSEVIRKKAVMVMQKVELCGIPSLIPDYFDKMKKALCDQDPSVMGAVLNLYLYSIKKDGAAQHKELTGSFVVILKQIIEHKLSKEFDYHRVPAPWLQIKLMQIMARLAQNDKKQSEQCYEILLQTLKKSDEPTLINIHYALMYSCIKCIATIYPNNELLEYAQSCVTKFLTATSQNLKVMGINLLALLIAIQPKFALDHQLTVVECLESSDETLRKQTLDLLFKMTNHHNVLTIVAKLMGYLNTADNQQFKASLVQKVALLSERFAPDQQWYITIMNKLFQCAPEHINNDILSTVLSVLKDILDNFDNANSPTPRDILLQFTRTLLELNANGVTLADPQARLIAWVLGEYGSSIDMQTLQADNEIKLATLLQQLLQLLNFVYSDATTRCWVLNAIAKLSSCLLLLQSQQQQQNQQLNAEEEEALNLTNLAFDKFQRSKNSEVAQRCFEYSVLAKYRACLRQSNMVEVDDTLSFLDGFVKKAINLGAKSVSIESFSSALNKDKPSQNFELKWKEYSTQAHSQKVESDIKTEHYIKTSANPWDTTGYSKPIEAKTQSNVSTPAMQGISSQTSQSSNKAVATNAVLQGFGSTGNDKDKKVESKGKLENVVQFGGGGFGMKNDMMKITGPLSGRPEEKKIVDPRLQQVAHDIFEGISGKSTQNALFAGIGSGSQKSLPSLQVQDKIANLSQKDATSSQNNQVQVQKNLLDMDLLGDNNDDLLYAYNTQQQSNTQIQTKKENNLDSFFQKHAITLQEFEQLWGSYPFEKIENIKSRRIFSEHDYCEMLKNINFSVVEIIGNEIIASALNQNNQKVMMFGSFANTGDVEIRIKSLNEQDLNLVVKIVKEQAL